MAITTLNNRAINRSDTAAADQLWTATSATATDFQAVSAGKIGQVLQAVKTDTDSETSTSYADLPDMTLAITPSATSSKILVIVYAGISGSDPDVFTHVQLVRTTTAIAVGDAASSRTRCSFSWRSKTPQDVPSNSIVYLDSPSSTSAITYKLQWKQESGTGYINRTGADTDNSTYPRTASTITVMEVLA